MYVATGGYIGGYCIVGYWWMYVACIDIGG